MDSSIKEEKIESYEKHQKKQMQQNKKQDIHIQIYHLMKKVYYH